MVFFFPSKYGNLLCHFSPWKKTFVGFTTIHFSFIIKKNTFAKKNFVALDVSSFEFNIMAMYPLSTKPLFSIHHTWSWCGMPIKCHGPFSSIS
jgi:hypothetical protein